MRSPGCHPAPDYVVGAIEAPLPQFLRELDRIMAALIPTPVKVIGKRIRRSRGLPLRTLRKTTRGQEPPYRAAMHSQLSADL